MIHNAYLINTNYHELEVTNGAHFGDVAILLATTTIVVMAKIPKSLKCYTLLKSWDET